VISIRVLSPRCREYGETGGRLLRARVLGRHIRGIDRDYVTDFDGQPDHGGWFWGLMLTGDVGAERVLSFRKVARAETSAVLTRPSRMHQTAASMIPRLRCVGAGCNQRRAPLLRRGIGTSPSFDGSPQAWCRLCWR